MAIKIFTAGEVLTAEDLNEQFQQIVSNNQVTSLNSLAQYIFSGNIVVNSAIIANGSAGILSQVLTSNGSSVYWSYSGVNAAAQYVWTNTHTFQANVTLSSVIANNSIGAAGQVLTSNGSSVYWSYSGVNAAAQYVWTNTHTFEANILFQSNITIGNSTANTVIENSNVTTNNIILKSNLTVGNSSVNTAITTSSISTTNFSANSTLVNAAALNITNQINTATLYTTTSANIASVVQANSSGLFNIANTILGSDSANRVTFNALVLSSIVPATNATYDIGAPTSGYWKNVYTNAIFGTTGTFSGNVTIGGDFIISGNTVSLSGNVITFTDNMLYLNQGILATITNITSNGTHVIFTANNNFSVGWDVVVTSVTPSSYNGTYHNIFAANSSTFTVANTNVDAYVSGGTARGKSDVNPDLGFAAGYNDGTYHHTGFFRDATDSKWKIFDNYTPEPDTSIYIDTADASFHLADFQANTLYLGNTSVNWLVSNTSGIYHTGTINATSYTVGTSTIANSTGVYTGTVNATTISTTTITQGSVLRDSFSNTTTGATGQIVDSWPVATYRSAKYTLSVKDNNANAYLLSEILVLFDTANALITEYGRVISNTSFGAFTANSNTTHVRLVFTPTSTNTTIKADRLLIAV